MLGVLLHESADAEFFGVEGVDQFADPADSFFERWDPVAELSSTDIILLQTGDDRITSPNAHLQGKVDSRGVDRIDEA